MNRIIYILVIILGLAMQNCTKEQTSECFPGIKLRYKYIHNNENTNLFDSQVELITAYVFDKRGLYYGSYSSNGEELTNSYIMDIPLSVGNYTIVTWGGEKEWTYNVGENISSQSDVFSQTLRPGVTSIQAFRLVLENYANDNGMSNYIEVERPADLFYGRVEEIEVDISSFATTTDVSLIKNTNMITVNVKGLSYLPAPPQKKSYTEDLPLNIYCVSKNGKYKYDNSLAETSTPIKYVPSYNMTKSNELTVEVNLMRLFIGDETMLVINEPYTNTNLFEKNLVDQILKSPEYNNQADIDRSDSFLFEVVINKDLSIQTFINGWEIIEINPEL